jgi:hypothetical protein
MLMNIRRGTMMTRHSSRVNCAEVRITAAAMRIFLMLQSNSRIDRPAAPQQM